mgnify:CR=1 FL=1
MCKTFAFPDKKESLLIFFVIIHYLRSCYDNNTVYGLSDYSRKGF